MAITVTGLVLIPSPRAIEDQATARDRTGQSFVSRTLLNLACRRGDLSACIHLGQIYELGLGVAADSSRAEAFFDKVGERHLPGSGRQEAIDNMACLTGDEESCWELAGVYLNGLGTAEDDARGAAFYNRAYDLNPKDPKNICRGLGLLYEESNDYPRAVGAYTKGCDAGDDSYSCTKLGSIYAHGGSGIVQDFKKRRGLRESMRPWRHGRLCCLQAA